MLLVRVAIIYLAIILFLSSCSINSENNKNKGNKFNWHSTVINQLNSSDHNIRGMTAIDLEEQRGKLIAELLRVAELSDKGKLNKLTKKYAIWMLGIMRSEDATDFLINNVKFEGSTRHMEFVSFPKHPCAEALVAIGMPAVSRIWGEMCISRPDDETLRLYAKVLKEIYGKEDCLVLMKHRIEKWKKHNQEYENLEKAIDIINKLN